MHLEKMTTGHLDILSTTEGNQSLTRAETVKSLACIFSVSQSTFLLVLMKMTAWVMVKVSYKSHSVSSFHSWVTIPAENKNMQFYSLLWATMILLYHQQSLFPPSPISKNVSPHLFLHIYVELADTLQGQLLLLYQDPHRFTHELLCDVQNIGRHGGRQEDNLKRFFQINIFSILKSNSNFLLSSHLYAACELLEDLINLVLEPSTEHLISLIQHKHFDVFRSCKKKKDLISS